MVVNSGSALRGRSACIRECFGASRLIVCVSPLSVSTLRVPTSAYPRAFRRFAPQRVCVIVERSNASRADVCIFSSVSALRAQYCTSPNMFVFASFKQSAVELCAERRKQKNLGFGAPFARSQTARGDGIQSLLASSVAARQS